MKLIRWNSNHAMWCINEVDSSTRLIKGEKEMERVTFNFNLGTTLFFLTFQKKHSKMHTHTDMGKMGNYPSSNFIFNK